MFLIWYSSFQIIKLEDAIYYILDRLAPLQYHHSTAYSAAVQCQDTAIRPWFPYLDFLAANQQTQIEDRTNTFTRPPQTKYMPIESVQTLDDTSWFNGEVMGVVDYLLTLSMSLSMYGWIVTLGETGDAPC